MTATSPFKYLDYYDVRDEHRFFGRDSEVALLESELIVSRLVVLFAKTGTGKTSLMNAGVRPLLDRAGYETLYIRVEDDPSAAAIEALRRHLPSDGPEEASLPGRIRRIRTVNPKPIVLFFDQFEEFFEHVTDESRREAFVEALATLYHDPSFGVHSVLSMREEYLHELDSFRDALPTIFHRGSNLRLRPLSPESASSVIVRTGAIGDVTIDQEVATRIVDDLVAVDGAVALPRLQIVCDTLWHAPRKDPDRVTVGDFERLGGGRKSVTATIYERRIESDLAQHLTDRELELLERVVPLLRTERATKRPRQITELADALAIDHSEAERLVSELDGFFDKVGELRLIRFTTHFGVRHVEWTSDYLAALTDQLQHAGRRLRLSRLVAASRARSDQGDALSAADASQLLSVVSADAAILAPHLSAQELTYLLRAALLAGENDEVWFRQAERAGLDALSLIERTIVQRDDRRSSSNALRLLSQLDAIPSALELLQGALANEHLRPDAVEAVIEAGSPSTKRRLTEWLVSQPASPSVVGALEELLTPEAVDALAQMVARHDSFAFEAGGALARLASDERLAVHPRAKSHLDQLLRGGAAEMLLRQSVERASDADVWAQLSFQYHIDVCEVLEQMLTERHGERLPEAAVQLLASLATGLLNSQQAVRAMGLLRTGLDDNQLAPFVVEALARVQTREAVELLVDVARRPELASAAATGLYRIAARRRNASASLADDALAEFPDTAAVAVFEEALDHGDDAAFWFERASERGCDVWQPISRRLEGPQPERALSLLENLASQPDENGHRARELLGSLPQTSRGKPSDLPKPPARLEPARQVRPSRAGLEDREWQVLMARIADNRCVPIIGPGSAGRAFPLPAELAQTLAREYAYPLGDSDNLAHVTEFISRKFDNSYATELIGGLYSAVEAAPTKVHAALADLPLTVYVVTAYDDLMLRALERAGKSPVPLVMPWRAAKPEHAWTPDVEPSVVRPVVFHMFGAAMAPDSLAVTPTDYLDWLVTMAQSRDQLLPRYIWRALVGSSLVALGESFWSDTWRVLVRALMMDDPTLRRLSVMVALPPSELAVDVSSREEAAWYMAQTMNSLGFRIQWSAIDEFAEELAARWRSRVS